MKCPSYTDESTVLCHMEKAETRLDEVKIQPVSPRKTVALRFPATASISTPVDTRGKGLHNKENYQNKRLSLEETSDDEAILSSGGLTEDSGYLSFQNSRVEHGDVDCEDISLSSQTAGSQCPSASCLPVLKFQEEVCRELAKSFKSSRSFDWTVVDKVAENYSLHTVIGGRMGRPQVDVFCGLLRKDMRHVLAKILGLLGGCDLVSCKKVSRTWRKIIRDDHVAAQRCREAEGTQRDLSRAAGSLSRDFTSSRVVFSCMQTVASTPIHKAVKKPPCQTGGAQNSCKSSRFQQFQEVAGSLQQHESLRACARCGCPARFDSGMQRAVCTRTSCAFEFCTLCRAPFHETSPCRTAIRTFPTNQKSLVAGSARSKRNVRRL